MKKLILSALLLFGLVASAQNSQATQIILEKVKQSDERQLKEDEAAKAKKALFEHPNKEFIISLSKLDQSQAREFADKIAFTGKTKRVFLTEKISSNGKGYFVKYVAENTSRETIREILKGSIDCDDCMTVIFTISPGTENNDQSFAFKDVVGSYLDLFPIWQSIFRPDVTLEKTSTDFSSQELKHAPSKINFKFKKAEDLWVLERWPM